LLIKPDDKFITLAEQQGEQSPRPLYFSTAGNFRLFNGKLAGMTHNSEFVLFDQQQTKTDAFNFNHAAAPEPDHIWLALQLPEGVNEVKDLSIYFDCRSSNF